MKKLLAFALMAALVLTMVAGCASTAPATEAPKADAPAAAEAPKADEPADEAPAADEAPTANSDFKVGFIFLHDENSTYDKNFLDAALAACANVGLADENVMIKTNIPESNDCYEAAAEMVDAGCNLIFADSFGHESYVLQAAQEFPEVQFAHATGVTAHTAGAANFHNAFADIYKGRFLAGVAAGMKLNEMIEAGTITADQALVGYVGAYPYEEVKSGYTSFFLGVRYMCPTATMEVKFTNSWFDIAKEKEAAISLINDGCVLISQHADSEGAPKACEENNVPNVTYNISTIDIAPNTALIATKINWVPYFEKMLKAAMAGENWDIDYCATMDEGAVEVFGINDKVAAAGTAEKIEELKAKLSSGELQVFDCSTFTVGGQAVTSYIANVDADDAYEPDTEVVKDGAIHESEFRSAPYFGLDIDGITLK